MKGKKNQRLLALILSMVLMLGASISAMAQGEAQTEVSGTETEGNQAAQSLEGETVPEEAVIGEEISADKQTRDITEEPSETITEETTETYTEDPSETISQESAEKPSENDGENETTVSEGVPEESQEEQTSAGNTAVTEPAQIQSSGQTQETFTAEETYGQEQPEEAVSEAAELTQEFTDENGNVTQTVTAYVPEGAFQATADQISMEVSLLDTDDTNYIKGMMEELLTENYYLDGYVLYQINFKVNGEITQPAKAVTISMTGNDLAVEDIQKAHVFYYDPEDPEVEDDEDQLAEVLQKDQLIKSLEESGESTENIEDYDYSEIAVNEGNADTITVKGWESTIYGCYVEKEAEPVTLEGSAEDIHVTLTGPASSFPDEGELALSVKEVNKKTDKLAEKAVEEQAEKEDLEVLDYTALDITILKDGEEIQPLGPVNVTFTKEEKEEKEKTKDAKPDQIKVFHVDEETGKAQDMEATESEEGKVEIETDHFSIYVVVDLDQLGGQIDLTVQHWATVNQLTGVDGTDGLIESAGPDGVAGNATASLKSEDVFTRIYTDDVLKLDNTLKKNIEELSKVLLASADKENKNYELSEIWFLNDGKSADSTNRDDWTIYQASSDATVNLTKDTTVRLVYNPLSHGSSLAQDVTFYDYDVTDGKRYNANGQEDPNGNYLNTTDKGINSDSNYKGGNEFNRLAVGMNSTWVDHKYHNAKSQNGNGVILNWSGGLADDAKKGIVTGINADGPIYNGVDAPQLFNDIPQIGKTVIDGYQLHFSQVGDTYTLSSVTNSLGSTVLSNLETLREIWDGKTDGKARHIFSNNFWPLDGEQDAKDPLLGGSTAYKVKKVHTNTGTKDVSPSDDGKAHNWLFGMRYSFEFTLGDYTGPLNFYFRGDDDFWLFVDGVLRTDLGGIHSSVGANLDLSQCIDMNDRTKTHRIEILYTERGCFGSTCYMQFTIPNVKPVEFEPEVEKTTVTVEKNWEDFNNPNRPASIDIELYYKKDGSSDWTKYDTQTLNQANNWKHTWSGLPKYGYSYKVKEAGEENGQNGNYKVTYESGTNTDGTLALGQDGSFNGTITNTLNPSTWITVDKVWEDESNVSDERPESVDFYLYYREKGKTDWTPYPDGRLTLKQENAKPGDSNTWTGKYENLPVYAPDGKTFLEYTVMEVEGNTPLKQEDKLDGKTQKDLYTVTYQDGHIAEDGTWTGYEAKKNEETFHLTVTNSYGVTLKVVKDWKGTDLASGTEIYVGLYKAERPVEDKILKLNQGNSWTDSFTYLALGSDYSVKELRPVKDGENPEFTIDGKGYVGVGEGQQIAFDGGRTYMVSYSDLSENSFTITNQEIWRLVKRSSSSTDDILIPLKDAEFTLQGPDNKTYTGTSDANGTVTWKQGDTEFTGAFPDGQYTLTETKAPTGYALGNSVTFTINEGIPENLGTDNTGMVKDGILTFYYDNTALYELPSAAGDGIQRYIIGGMLLTMAGLLVLYRIKRREVSKR